ncbi:MAG: nitroreductase [Bacillus subtilis]|nr:nitroreductase [Bacillus subtilis]
MKNPMIDLIMSRRSIRQYSEEPVSEETLKMIVECGIHAPTSRNKQTWHFTVMTDLKTIETVNEMILAGMDRLGIKKEPGYHVFYHAPVVIFLSSAIEGFSEINCGCAIENIALAAKALGLGSVVVGQTRYMFHQANVVDVNRLLKIPEGYEHDCAICIGHPAGPAPDPKTIREGVVDYIR